MSLIKALYWRLFGLFRWMLFHTEQTCQPSLIYQMLKDKVNSTDTELLELAQWTPMIAQNILNFENFLKKHMPAYVGKFEPDQFKFIDTLKKKSLTRDKKNLKQSFISHKSVSTQDSYIILDKADQVGPGGAPESVISLEEALNLYLLIPFSPLSLSDR